MKNKTSLWLLVIAGAVVFAACVYVLRPYPDSGDDPSIYSRSAYVVREGDTLASIATAFGVSPNAMLWDNHLSKNSTLQVGQTLSILPVTGVQYTVKRGDTPESIARHFKKMRLTSAPLMTLPTAHLWLGP
jgi:nucleoid-associated protein YgaU